MGMYSAIFCTRYEIQM